MTALIAILTNGSAALAALIPLQSTWTPGPNKAPPYYIWQNDPGLTEFLNADGVSSLCVPASISNALLYQYAFKAKTSTRLKLPGLVTDPATGSPAADSNAMIRYFAQACGFTNANGTTLAGGAECIAQFYKDSGYDHAQVRMIRRNVSGLSKEVTLENRVPTTDDIRKGLDEGYEVIASVITMSYEATQGKWIKRGSHSFNVYGIEKNELIISNPTRAYRMNFIDPVFDRITFDEIAFSESMAKPEPYSSIRLVGRLINRGEYTTFLAGLTLIRPE